MVPGSGTASNVKLSAANALPALPPAKKRAPVGNGNVGFVPPDMYHVGLAVLVIPVWRSVIEVSVH